MFQKGHKFFADWRDESGKRKRKSFITAKAALMFEKQQKAARPNSPAPGLSKAILQAQIDTYRDKVPHRDIAAVLRCSVRTIYPAPHRPPPPNRHPPPPRPAVTRQAIR